MDFWTQQHMWFFMFWMRKWHYSYCVPSQSPSPTFANILAREALIVSVTSSLTVIAGIFVFLQYHEVARVACRTHLMMRLSMSLKPCMWFLSETSQLPLDRHMVCCMHSFTAMYHSICTYEVILLVCHR